MEAGGFGCGDLEGTPQPGLGEKEEVVEDRPSEWVDRGLRCEEAHGFKISENGGCGGRSGGGRVGAMRTDTYKKAVLTVIAVFLGMLVFKQYLRPDVVAQAQSGFAGVQFSGADYFDSKTGDIWVYGGRGLDRPLHYRMARLGEPLVQIK